MNKKFQYWPQWFCENLLGQTKASGEGNTTQNNNRYRTDKGRLKPRT